MDPPPFPSLHSWEEAPTIEGTEAECAGLNKTEAKGFVSGSPPSSGPGVPGNQVGPLEPACRTWRTQRPLCSSADVQHQGSGRARCLWWDFSCRVIHEAERGRPVILGWRLLRTSMLPKYRSNLTMQTAKYARFLGMGEDLCGLGTSRYPTMHFSMAKYRLRHY